MLYIYIWKHLYVYDSLSLRAGSLLGFWLWKLIRISCILLITAELAWEAKHFCDRTQREEKGAKGHINPCQCRPNYLSPCANKQCPGQPVGGGGWGGVWGPWGLPATLQPDPHHSCSYLSSSALSSLLLRHGHQAPVTIHRAAEELPCLHFRLLWHFLPDFPLFVSIWSSRLCNTDQAWWKLQFMCASCLCVYE